MSKVYCEICRVAVLGECDGDEDKYAGACEACVPIPGISPAEEIQKYQDAQQAPQDDVATLRAQAEEILARLAAIEAGK